MQEGVGKDGPDSQLGISAHFIQHKLGVDESEETEGERVLCVMNFILPVSVNFRFYSHYTLLMYESFVTSSETYILGVVGKENNSELCFGLIAEGNCQFRLNVGPRTA